MIPLNDKSVISSKELNKHNIARYEFKSIDENLEIKKVTNTAPQNKPNKSKMAIDNHVLEKDLLEKLLLKNDYLANMLDSFQMQFEVLQDRIQKMQKAFEDAMTNENISANLAFEDSNAQRENIVDSIAKLDSTIENTKNQILSLESNLITIALDIAKKVIVKEIAESSSKVAASIANEILHSLSGNLKVIIKVNPVDFEFLNRLAKDKININIESDNAVKRGGVVVVGEGINIDGNVMSRYQLLKQSIFGNIV